MLGNWHKKEKPVFTGVTRGLGGFGFGGGGGGGSADVGVFSASGGQKFTVGSDTYHIFMNPEGISQTFTVSSGTSDCECLIVGGGGASRADNGGAGGGGGVVYAPALSFAAGSYVIAVGYGGTYNSERNNNVPTWGGHSKITHPVGTIIAYGGQGAQNASESGSNYPILTPWTGPDGTTKFGSGAGGARTNPSSNVSNTSPINDGQPSAPNFSGAVTNYGNTGGNYGPPIWNGSGGGGAGGPGYPGPSPSPIRYQGGAGAPFANFPGPGLYPNLPSPASSYLGTGWRDALTGTGLFAGGGGGTVESPASFYAGGPGGGSPGSNTGNNGVNGTGGGMGSNNQTAGTFQGGDGIVIIKYATP